MFRAMQSSSATLLPKGGAIDGGSGGEEAAAATAPSVFLTADIWCKTINALAQVGYDRWCEEACEAPNRNAELVYYYGLCCRRWLVNCYVYIQQCTCLVVLLGCGRHRIFAGVGSMSIRAVKKQTMVPPKTRLMLLHSKMREDVYVGVGAWVCSVFS